MKNFAIGFVLLTTSFGAHAFFNCSFETLKPLLFNKALVTSVKKLEIENDSKYSINDYLITSISRKPAPYTSAFWFNGFVGCTDEGFCTLEGVVTESLNKILIDGTAEYVTQNEHAKIKITKDQAQDVTMVDDKGKRTVIRIECN